MLSHRWTFRIVAVILGCLPVVLFELGLRWLESGNEPRIPNAGFQGSPLFELNQRTQRWEINPDRSDFFCQDSFHQSKPANSKRIFVLGGSTVQGRPFAIETAFSTFLELRLKSCTGQDDFEVVNCGGVSYASYRVARILKEVLTYEADAIVLYTGHNEFLEDREFRKYDKHGSDWLVHLASHFRTVGWLRQRFRSNKERPLSRELPESQFTQEVQTRLDRKDGLKSYSRDESWRQAVHQQFEQTVLDMKSLCQKHEIPLIVCVPASDAIKTPPFKVQADPGQSAETQTRVRSLWQRIKSPESNDQQRERDCRELLQLDSHHAGANYVLGRKLVESSINHKVASSEAKHCLITARDYDVCPLRATSMIEEFVRSLAEHARSSWTCRVIDIPQLFDAPPGKSDLQNDGIASPEWFVDHVHPTLNGHRRIAEALVGSFEELGWVRRSPGAAQRYQAAEQEHLRMLGEEYYHRGQQRLEGLKRWASGRAGNDLFE